MTEGPGALRAALEATWPPAAWHRCGPFTLREGQGGGQRVSAAVLAGDGAVAPDRVTEDQVAAAEAGMAALGQPPLFQVWAEDAAVDPVLARRGHALRDPVTVMAGPLDAWAAVPPAPLSSYTIWPPLRMQTDLWAAGGIGAGRIAVMGRVGGPKTALLTRWNDRAAGVCFGAVHDKMVVAHAMVVPEGHRRKGAARNMLRALGAWAQDFGVSRVAVAVTAANRPARALYASMGMEIVGKYHYRATGSASAAAVAEG